MGEFEAIRQADMKVATIGWRLVTANAALCDRLEPGTGLQLHTLEQFDTASRGAARAHFGFATPVAVEGVVAGSPADHAGIKADDSLVRVGSVEIAALAGKPMTTDRLVAAQLAIAALPADEPMVIEVIRAGAAQRFTLQPIPVCRSRFELRIAPDWSASADGTMVQIGSRFVEEYADDQLAAVIAHELSHNILRHRVRLEERGANFGILSGFGANVKYFRQTELQADLLSVYLLTNADYPQRAAIDFWRKFGPSKAGGIFRIRSHPAWRDRIATLEAELAKIAMLSVRPVIPALVDERDRPLDGNWNAIIIRHR
ncbi:MAG: M48 family metalloprotease [Sphingomonas sp.]|uniref:M48 family metallopeptidase n=1 Tax=Sphingomonas sp. TaxID=28214 RepID=UPI0025EF2246|nr:M48 family metallopeptidase [Sphingomonas sp.]MBX3565263.1 M48 family metalloprotease [Sphingomonas sp.]